MEVLDWSVGLFPSRQARSAVGVPARACTIDKHPTGCHLALKIVCEEYSHAAILIRQVCHLSDVTPAKAGRYAVWMSSSTIPMQDNQDAQIVADGHERQSMLVSV